MQEVWGSNLGAAPPTLEPISPIPRLQVAKMRQGSRKGYCTRKPSTRDDKKMQVFQTQTTDRIDYVYSARRMVKGKADLALHIHRTAGNSLASQAISKADP